MDTLLKERASTSGGTTVRLKRAQLLRMAKANLSWVSVSFLLVFSFLLTASPGFASTTSAGNVYISQSGTGSGTSCADALPVSWFNNAANWGNGPTQIGPGTTAHLCGTFTCTSTGQQNYLMVQGSGSSGNPITIKFETNALMTCAAWVNGHTPGVINLSGQSWIVLDGGTNGTIQNTLNGTAGASCLGGPCSLQDMTTFVYMSSGGGAHDIEVKNLTCVDGYVHVAGADTSGGSTECVQFVNNNNITVDHITCHDTAVCINGWGNNFTMDFNELYNCNRCLTFGPTGGGTLTNTVIHDNYIHDAGPWDNPGVDTFHHDGVHLFPGGAATISGLQVYNNRFSQGGNCCQTADIYLEGNFTNPKVFNNVCDNTGGQWQWCLWTDDDIGGHTTNPLIYNNTIVGNPYNANGAFRFRGTTGITFENNVFVGGGGLITLDSTPSTIAFADYNTYDSGTGNGWNYNGTYSSTLLGWQTLCSCDVHSQLTAASAINLSSTGHPQSGSNVIGFATNLTSLGIALLDSDKPDPVGTTGSGVGKARPSNGNWDGGAYQSGAAANRPAPPTGLTATVQ
jgi:hypothetical protein